MVSTTTPIDPAAIARVQPINPSTRPIRAIHLTSWSSGSKKYRQRLDKLFETTVINAVIIDIKEYQGEVYIPGVKWANEVGAYVSAMPDLESWVADLKKRGIYTIARQVVYKDNILPRKHKTAGVRNHQGELWFDRHRNTWLDPYNKEARRYNLLIALRASEIGFDEVQFDYIRYPTDGNLKMIRYPAPHSRAAASQALVDFLAEARRLLHPRGTKISIDVFGLTTSDNTGMGIGQQILPMTAEVDYVCPMIYPSHYNRFEYGISEPNREPYKMVYFALRDAIKALGPQAHKLRPFLQDFSLFGVRYGVKEVRAQIQASADNGIQDWSLWNAASNYTLGAIETVATPNPKHSLIKASTHTKP